MTATKCAEILNARAKFLFFTRIRFCLKTDIFFLLLSLPSTLTNAVKNAVKNDQSTLDSLKSVSMHLGGKRRYFGFGL